jgi:hypothetical protein
MKTKWRKSADIVVFTITAALAGWVLAGGGGTGRRVTVAALAEADAAVGSLETAMERDSFAASESARVLESLTGLDARVRGEWNPPAAARPLSPGFMYHPGMLQDTREGKDLELRLLAPVALTASAEPGTILVHWARNERTTASVKEYRVYRATAGGEETLLATVPVETTMHTDHDVRAGVEYAYRVAAKSNEPGLERAGASESPKSDPVTQRAARDFDIKLTAYTEGAPKARFLVRRMVAGVWHEKEFEAATGEPIGARDAGSGVDYSTGCTLREMNHTIKVENDVREEVAFAPDGTVLLDGDVPRRRRVLVPREVKIWACVFTNELGEQESIELTR